MWNDDDFEHLHDDDFALPEPPGDLQARAFAATTTTLRRRRWTRHSATAAVVLAAFATGFGLGRSDAPQERVAESTTPIEEPASQGEQEHTPDVDVLDVEEMALAVAKAEPDRKAALLKEAGDRYLEERGDIRTALAYYQQHLRTLPADARSRVDTEDSWLLINLKTDTE